MKIYAALVAIAAALTACASAQPSTPPNTVTPEPSLDALIGVWDVALYYMPGEPPSSTQMEFTSVSDGVLEGSFYGTPFSSAKASLFRGEVIVSFMTGDGTGPYASAGRLSPGGGFEGQTLSVGRDFIMPWIATRRSGDD